MARSPWGLLLKHSLPQTHPIPPIPRISPRSNGIHRQKYPKVWIIKTVPEVHQPRLHIMPPPLESIDHPISAARQERAHEGKGFIRIG